MIETWEKVELGFLLVGGDPSLFWQGARLDDDDWREESMVEWDYEPPRITMDFELFFETLKQAPPEKVNVTIIKDLAEEKKTTGRPIVINWGSPLPSNTSNPHGSTAGSGWAGQSQSRNQVNPPAQAQSVDASRAGDKSQEKIDTAASKSQAQTGAPTQPDDNRVDMSTTKPNTIPLALSNNPLAGEVAHFGLFSSYVV